MALGDQFLLLLMHPLLLLLLEDQVREGVLTEGLGRSPWYELGLGCRSRDVKRLHLRGGGTSEDGGQLIGGRHGLS